MYQLCNKNRRGQELELNKIVFYSDCWGVGGIETFTLAAAEYAKKNGYEVEVFSLYLKSEKLLERLEQMGINLVVAFRNEGTLASREIKGPIAWKKYLIRTKPAIVHINIMNGWGLIYAGISRELSVPKIVVHSHSTEFGKGHKIIKTLMHNLGQALWGRCPTARLACSTEAGQYLFGNKGFTVIKNGINVELFRFKHKSRKELREELGIEKKIVFGSIGRIVDSKQPLFQLEILGALVSKGINAHLLIIGEGELTNRFVEEANLKGLSSKTTLLPATSNPAPFYSAYDVFTMPSKFEGLPVALIEALCSGLPCVVSNGVPDPGISGAQLIRVSSMSPEDWADVIVSVTEQGRSGQRRERAPFVIKESGYDCESAMSELMKVYSAC